MQVFVRHSVALLAAALILFGVAACSAIDTTQDRAYVIEVTWGEALDVFNAHAHELSDQQLETARIAILTYREAIHQYTGEQAAPDRMRSALAALTEIVTPYLEPAP